MQPSKRHDRPDWVGVGAGGVTFDVAVAQNNLAREITQQYVF